MTLAVDDENQLVVCYCSFGSRVPLERREVVPKTLNRLNWSIPIGNFALDVVDGELQFRTSIDVEGGELVSKMVENLIDCAVVTADRHHDLIMQAAFGMDEVEKLFAEMERDEEKGSE